MSYEYNLEPPCGDDEENMIADYMDVVRDEALEKLTTLERAAIFNDLKEFIVRYREDRELEEAQNRMD
jgi:hypothetical protein